MPSPEVAEQEQMPLPSEELQRAQESADDACVRLFKLRLDRRAHALLEKISRHEDEELLFEALNYVEGVMRPRKRDHVIERYLALEWVEHGLWLMRDRDIAAHVNEKLKTHGIGITEGTLNKMRDKRLKLYKLDTRHRSAREKMR